MASFLDYSPLFAVALATLSPSANAAAVLAFSPTPLDFGNVPLTESKLLRAMLTNSTAVNVKLTGITFSGTNAAEFSQTNLCPSPIPAGNRCVFSVKFKPTALTARSAFLAVKTDNPAAPTLTLQLKGNAYPTALNDTGLTSCGNGGGNGLACPVTGFPRQDAEQGRDKLHNVNTDGHAGFSFTKLDSNGKALTTSATAWNCVRDNVTGLIWEKKPKGDGIKGNQGLHDADDKYTWYNTDTGNNNGNVGDTSESKNDCYGYTRLQAPTWCNTEAYLKRVNAQGWCGAKDWRLPTRTELRSLVDLGVQSPGPAIDMGYFPDAVSSFYRSSSPYAKYYAGTWTVNFGDGFSGNDNHSGSYAVRLVRGGQ